MSLQPFGDWMTPLPDTAFWLFAPYPPVPFYHLEAGTFDANGLPDGLQFTSEAYLYDFYQTASPFQSATEQVETEGLMCGDELPYDDNLAAVNIPVQLYPIDVSAAQREYEYQATHGDFHEGQLFVAGGRVTGVLDRLESGAGGSAPPLPSSWSRPCASSTGCLRR